MLKGLEISVLNHSEVNSIENPTGRVDAEFFKKEFLALTRYALALGDIAIVRSGTTPSDRDDTLTVGVSLLKTVDIQNRPLNATDSDSFYKISPETAKKMQKTRLFANDLLINIVGATTDVVGRLALVPKGLPEANITQAMALIRLQDKDVMPEVIFAFLAGNHGQAQVRRLARPTGQYNLNIPEVESLRVPTISPKISNGVQVCVRKSLVARNESKKLLENAEITLLRALSLENWQAPEPLSYVCNSRDAFAAGRLDAQYFTPRVQALLDLLGEDGLTISDVAPLRREKFDPAKAGNTFSYIEIGDVQTDGSVESNELATNAAPSRASQYVRGGDILTSTVRPIRRLSALVTESQDGAVCSSGFVVLAPKGVSASTMLIYLRLPLVCELMDLHTSASLYPAISEQDLLALPIPRISGKVQNQIDALVGAARQAKQLSTRLLDTAKRTVEIAVEKNEKSAMAFLEVNI